MHNPTERVLKILNMVSQANNDLRLADFSKELEIPKTTLLPILQTLCANRYLTQGQNGMYGAGTALFSLAAAFRGCFPVREYIHDQLSELVSQFEETCYCGTLVDGMVLYLDKVDSPQPLRVLTNTGKRLPAYATSIGKSLLMDATMEDLSQLYPDGLKPLTARTVTDIEALFLQLQDAQNDGFTWEIEESTDHVRCFAAPIRKNGKIVAAISIAIPLFRYQEEKQSEIVSKLKEYGNLMGAMFENTNAHFGESF